MLRGCPKRIHSDQGKEFTSPVITEMIRVLGVGQRFSSAYRPQSGGQTERSHRFINDAISSYVNKNHHKDWDLWLYGAVFAHNATDLAEAPGISPFFLEHGREPVLPEEAGLQGHPPVNSSC